MSSLYASPVADVLDRLFAESEVVDPPLSDEIRVEVERRGGVIVETDLAGILDKMYISVDRLGGRFLYGLARSQGSKTIVEYGTSFGISTIHLAAAVRDNGGGIVVTTELNPEKADRARTNLADAGLLEYVDIRLGDARETLKDLDGPVDLLFLDGWKDLYLPILRMLEPRLRVGSIVVGDDLDILEETLRPYLDYVRDPRHGYTSVDIPLGDRLEFSVRT